MKSIEFLEKNNISFNKIILEEVPKSAADVERIFGCKLSQVLKTVVLIGEKPIVVVLQGNKKISFKKIKDLLKLKKVRIAQPDEVKEITGYSIEGVTPFGLEKNDFDFIFILDSNVLNEKTINIGSGKAEIGIELNSSDLEKIWFGKIVYIAE